MALLNSDEILKLIPQLFSVDIKDSKMILRNLEKVLVFDEGFIYFTNPDSLQLKYSYKQHANYELEKTFHFDSELKQFIFPQEGAVLKDDSNLVDCIELKGSRQNHI